MIGTELDSIQEATTRALLEIERSICPSTEIETMLDAQLRATFETGLAWIQRFIMQPHPDLGRKGPVCPFARPAHEAKAIQFCAVEASGMSFDVFIDVMMRMRSVFYRVAGKLPGRANLLSLCLFPMNLRADSYYKYIDCAHSMLKPFYMNAGLMLGEFHPLSAVRGAHSEKICPMRADLPVFVIRSISLHDLIFIDSPSAAPGIRIHELECYLRSVGNLLPPGEAARINERIQAIQSQWLGDRDSGARQASSAAAPGQSVPAATRITSSTFSMPGVAQYAGDCVTW